MMCEFERRQRLKYLKAKVIQRIIIISDEERAVGRTQRKTNN